MSRYKMPGRQKQDREAGQVKEQEQGHLSCRVCGSKMKPEASFWEAGDGGGMYCLDCTAERESCGCSD